MRNDSQISAGTLNSQTSTTASSSDSPLPNSSTLKVLNSSPGIQSPLPKSQTPQFLNSVILPPQPRFRLEKRPDGWVVHRGAEQSLAKPEIGFEYAAWFMNHPNESMHALDLAARIHATSGKCKYTGLTEIEDPRTGKKVPVGAGARVQERGMYLEQAETMRAVLRQQERLEALLESDDITEPEKEEVYRQLIDLYNYEKMQGPRVRDAAGRASDAVGRALTRLHQRLHAAVGAHGEPDEVLRAFANHVRECILKPSKRGGYGSRKKRSHGGWFTYVPS